jgi:gamma-glutamylcyclotransferase (GGCT)/AIG2-like uncharacterized protein YtfP
MTYRNSASKSIETRETPTGESRITLFVYGTLKKGQCNHDHFCKDAVDIRPAWVWGRIYRYSAGFPTLVIPTSLILAEGTDDPCADAATQALQAKSGFNPDIPDQSREGDLARPEGDWDRVRGELVTFADPCRSLPSIDSLESFRPGQVYLYTRVLVPVHTEGGAEPAWLYAAQERNLRLAMRIRSGVWTAERS